MKLLRTLFGTRKRKRRTFAAELGAVAGRAGEDVAFYAGKSTGRPRFAYRRLAFGLDRAADDEERRRAIAAFREEIETAGGRGEGLKLRLNLPDFVETRLLPDERAELEAFLSVRRERRLRLRDAYPDCVDEFGVAPAFLDTVLEVAPQPAIAPETRIFTLGSCFARNIAVYLPSRGYSAEAFVQTEDLNSPFSNARMFRVAAAPAAEREAFVRRWIETLYPDDEAAERGRRAEEALARLFGLAESVARAEVVVVTIGSALDFFLPAEAGGDVAPKFLLLADTEGADRRAGLAQRLKAQGARFRLGTFAESREAIRGLHAAIRALNPSALCLFTLSPVPMDSAIGVEKAVPGGAAEIDCVSKSTLRAALHEAMSELAATDAATRYFPSYEIVRWIAPNMPGRVFGAEDASARHVSEEVLNGVYGYFLRRFGRRDGV